MAVRNEGVIGPDGVRRSEGAEKRILEVFDETFKPECGLKVIEYLRSISTNVAAGPEVSDAHLRHLEGQRYVVGLIVKWQELAVKRRKAQNE